MCDPLTTIFSCGAVAQHSADLLHGTILLLLATQNIQHLSADQSHESFQSTILRVFQLLLFRVKFNNLDLKSNALEDLLHIDVRGIKSRASSLRCLDGNSMVDQSEHKCRDLFWCISMPAHLQEECAPGLHILKDILQCEETGRWVSQDPMECSIGGTKIVSARLHQQVETQMLTLCLSSHS